MLSGVEDGEDLDAIRYAIDQDVVRMDHRLARTREATGTIEIGVRGKGLSGVPDCSVQALGGAGLRAAI